MELAESDAPNQSLSLESFIDFLYEGLEGYVYLSASEPGVYDDEGKKDWKQEFFEYPVGKHKLIKAIRGASKTHEVYIAPAVFKSTINAQRSNVKACNVVWTEFDGNAPDWNDSNLPSLVIQSSEELHQHVYWKLNEPVTNVDVLEDINRRITYNMGADFSAWDATQVLRPPETIHHETNLGVHVINFDPRIYDIDVFRELAPAPKQEEIEWELSVLPNPQDVILKYAFPPDMQRLITTSAEKITDRSAALMNLAYGCAQIGLTNNEIMVLLIALDDKVGKFKYRRDRLRRLSHIITVARNKYPSEDEDETPFTLAFGFESFLDTEISIDWVIEPMLMESGSMLMVGPSGIGKSQFALQVAINLALGNDFLHYKVPNRKKVAFISLEMGHGELKIFVEAMNNVLDDAQRAILEENLTIVPHGEPWFLNEKLGQEQLINLIEEKQLEGILVDSIGSALNGNISSDEVVQPLTRFNDQIRKKYGLFLWYIHHMRKSKDGISTQDDVYGNQYILNRSTSTYALLRAKSGNIRVKNFKNRLAPHEKDYIVSRDENLIFHNINEDVDEQLENLNGGDPDIDPNDPKNFKTGTGIEF